MRFSSHIFLIILVCLSSLIQAQDEPCDAFEFQLSDYGLIRTLVLTSNQYDGLIYPTCGNYQGDEFWLEFQAPTSGAATIELFPGSVANPIADGAFDLWYDACGGLTLLHGCYSDTDCGQELMPSITLGDLVPGGRYFMRIYQEGGGAGSIDVRISDPLGTEFNLGGSAVEYDSGIPGQTCIELTPASGNERGCAWFPVPINFNNRFEIDYQLFFGDKNDNGADGIVFFFHGDGPNPGCSGTAGGFLGLDGINESVYFEFDTYQNGGELSQDHAEVKIDLGFLELTVMSPTPIGAGGNVEDNMWHNVKIVWNPDDSSLEMWFDGALLMRRELAQFTQFFVGRDIWWGVVATTGGLNNVQRFCYNGFTVTNSTSYEVSDDVKICKGDTYFAEGTNQSEAGEYVDVYLAANGCDSTVTTILSISELEPIYEETVQLSCLSTGEIQLDASDSTSDGIISINWSTNDGNIVSGGNTLTPIVDAPGTYEATIIDLGTGCSEGLEIVVEPSAPPTALASAEQLACADQINLDGSSSIGQGDLIYSWTSSDGNILQDEDTATPLVDSPGTYILVITDGATGCTAETNVLVEEAVSVEAGNDVFVCGEDLPVSTELEGTIDGQVISFEWLQTTGLNNPAILNPIATVSQPTSYELIATIVNGGNLVVNGDFELGNDYFFTDYTFSNSANQGNYTISNNPNNFYPSFSDCPDHTTGSGDMIIIDSSNLPDQKAWCQTINIKPNTDYLFSAWFQNVCVPCGPADPEVSFMINDIIIDVQTIDPNVCTWHQLNTTWNSESNLQAEFCFATSNEILNGNDFAIDDIELLELCYVRDEVEIGIEVIDMQIFQPTINCYDEEAEILAMPNTGDNGNYIYTWTSADGTIVSDANSNAIDIMGAGTYTLVVTNTDNSCTKSFDVIPLTDFEEPVAVAVGGELTCELAEIAINGIGSTDTGVSYSWQTSDGNIVSGADALEVIVDSPGSYELIVTSTSNGCMASQIVEVTSDENSPEVIIDEAIDLTCIDTQIILDASQSDSGSDYSYAWTSQDGTITIGEDSLNPEIDGPGTYVLTITNLLNGCSSNSSIIVEQIVDEPMFSILEPLELNCDLQNTLLSIDIDNNTYEYSWTTQDGNILSGASSELLEVSSPGTYVLLVTNSTNGCTSEQQVLVSQNLIEPQFDIASPQIITCNATIVSLESQSNNSNLSYTWTDPNGMLLTANSSTIEVNTIGVYELMVIDESNGCSSVQSIEVFEDIQGPQVEAGDGASLDCAGTPVQLSGSSINQNVSYSWTTSDGNILSGETSLNPEVNAPGTYTLVVTNDINGCTSADAVEVLIDTDAPYADAGQALVINCINQTAFLDGSNSDSGSNISFEWTTTNGNFLSGTNTLNPEVDMPGVYFLTLVNDDNLCETISSVEVSTDFEQPSVDLGGDLEIDCLTTEFNIGDLLANPDYSYNWSSTNGNILSPTDGSSISLNQAGTYLLELVNVTNGCTSSSSINVAENLIVPELEILGDNMLDCQIQQISLQSETDAASVSYLWSTMDGNIIEGENSDEILINQAGNYQLILTDNINGCTALEEFLVSQNSDLPEIEILEPTVLNCATQATTLDATNSSMGSEFAFNWSSQNGQIVGDPNQALINISSAGEYQLIITNELSSCSSEQTILVLEDLEAPEISIQLPEQLSCSVESLNLSAETNIGNYLYEWTANPGNIVGGESSLNPLIDQAGFYTLIITNSDNGCTAEEEVQVLQDADSPSVIIEEVHNIDCNNSTVVLNATNSSQGQQYELSWTTDTGNFLTGQNTLSPEVDAAGIYTLSILNTENDCEVFSTVTIAENLDLPSINIEPFADLNCANNSIFINASSSSSGAEFEYIWTSVEGDPIVNANGLAPELNFPGSYELTIINSETGCENETTILIEQDIEEPIIMVMEPLVFNCELNIQALDANVTSNGSNFDYLWTTIGGNFLSSSNELNPVIDQAGIYTLEVTNLDNLCSNSIVVEVLASIDSPEINILDPGDITCIDTELTLISESTIANLEYSWSTSDGNILSDLTSADIQIDAAGTYLLEVMNTENLCSNLVEFSVNSIIEYPEVSINNAPVLDCETQEIDLQWAGSNGANFEIIWDTENGNILDVNDNIPTIAEPGTYSLTIINSLNGCSSTESLEVDQNIEFPLTSISQPENLDCASLETNITANALGATGLIYNWSTVNGNILQDQQSEEIIVDQVGIYEVEIINPENSCREVLSVEVFGNFETPLIDAGEGFELNCNLTESNLDANIISSGNYEINWSTSTGNIQQGVNGLQPQVNAAGLYYFLVTDNENSCESLDSLYVTRNENIPNTIISEVNPALCFGDMASISIFDVQGGEGPFVYSLDGEDFSLNQDFENLVPGNSYNINIEDLNGCQLDTILSIPNIDALELNVVPEVNLNIGENYQILASTSIPESEISEIIWTPSSFLSCNDCLNPVSSPVSDISYTVTIINENGCSESAEIILRVDREISVYIPSAFSPHNDDGVNDVFMIFSDQNTITNIKSFQIYDRWGIRVFDRSNFQPNLPEFGWDGIYRSKSMQPNVFVWFAEIELISGEVILLNGDVSLVD